MSKKRAKDIPYGPHSPDWMSHLEFLDEIARNDVAGIKTGDTIYNGSWKRRGGLGAFMMLCRKWDRLEHRVEHCGKSYDVFHAIATDTRREGCIDDVRDLRRYLMLVEAEMLRRGFSREHRDNAPEKGKRKGGDVRMAKKKGTKKGC